MHAKVELSGSLPHQRQGQARIRRITLLAIRLMLSARVRWPRPKVDSALFRPEVRKKKKKNFIDRQRVGTIVL